MSGPLEGIRSRGRHVRIRASRLVVLRERGADVIIMSTPSPAIRNADRARPTVEGRGRPGTRTSNTPIAVSAASG